MKRSEYFLKAVVSDAIYLRHWGLSLFSILEEGGSVKEYPWLMKRQGTEMVFLNPETGKWERFEDFEPGTPFCHPRDPILLPKGHLENNKDKAYNTSFGNVFLNQLLFVLPFGDKVPYQEGYVTAAPGYKLAIDKMVDDPEEGEEIPEGCITASQYAMFGEHVQQCVSFNDCVVHYSTPKSMLAHPLAKKLKAELMEKFKGRLNDPVVIAKIGDELEALDRAFLEDDPIMDFYTSSKYFAKIRKKLYYMFGAESAFKDGNEVDFIPNSLIEGIDVNQLPELINSARYGSYSRGALTQLGGSSAKQASRATSTIEVSKDDCGTKLGILSYPQEGDWQTYVGRYVIADGKTTLIDYEYAKTLIGKTVRIRSPMYCRANEDSVSYCACCLGRRYSEAPEQLSSIINGVSGTITNIFMGAMHGRELKTAEFVPELCVY